MNPFVLANQQLTNLEVFRNKSIEKVVCDVDELVAEQPSEPVDLLIDILSIQEGINDKCEISIDTMNLVTIKLHYLDVKWTNLLCRLLARIN